MSFVDIFLLAMALSVDAAVVSFSYGLLIRKNRAGNALKIAFSTGFGQFVMPIIGWLGTSSISAYLSHFDHWISFLVFVLLGLNVIHESLHQQENEVLNKNISFKCMLAIGVATSIDACAAGVTLYFINVSILLTSGIIGITTLICSLSAFYLSRSFPKIPTQKIEIASGVILILLGVKVLCEHLLL